MNQIELKEVIDSCQSPLLVTYEEKSGSEFDFHLYGKNHIWRIRLTFKPTFPYSLPHVKLLNSELIGLLPHVSIIGTLCIEESDSVLINHGNPKGVVTYIIEEAVKLLDRSSLKIFQDELTDEFEGFIQPICTSVNSFYTPGKLVENAEIIVKKTIAKKDEKIIPVCIKGKKDRFPDLYSNTFKLKDYPSYKLIHISLERTILPPNSKKALTVDYLYSMKKCLSEDNKIRLKQLLAGTVKSKNFFLLFTMPRTVGGLTQIFFHLSCKAKEPHPMHTNSQEWEVTPSILHRHNREYLLERGGADISLSNKNVTVIGCGSVGGEIVAMLAKAGIGNFTLIDFDILEVDNIYRHRVGGMFINYSVSNKHSTVQNMHKVNAMEIWLKSDFPHMKVTPIPKCFYSVEDSVLLNSDIVIIAVGSPSLSMNINRKLKMLNCSHAIFCWNEAAGAGGHSVVLNLKDTCYECLFSDDEKLTMICDLNLLEVGQNISKNLTGCGGVFTPFSYLDSSQTASLAARQCIESLLGVCHSKALTWKGSKPEGLNVTGRFTTMSLNEEVDLLKKSGCSVCNDR